MGVERKKVSSHMEDYLEAIAFLKKGKGVARVNDIGLLLRVKNPSVHAALTTLAKKNLVVHRRYGTAELTVEGARVAAGVQKRHDVIFRFLTEILGVERKNAQAEACRMEHAISDKTLEKLMKFVERGVQSRCKTTRNTAGGKK
jgi:DtxR family Mn-dependent transcriptional regulator